MSFGEKLRMLRKSKSYSLDTLVDIYNDRFGGKLNKSTVSRYENGLQEPMFTVVKNFADIFNVSTDFLTDLDTNSFRNIYGIPNISSVATQRIPFLGEIACGEPIYASEDRESYVEVGTDIKADFCLKAKGDSMINARIFNGDIVFIRKQPMVENGEIAAVIIDDEATLKRVYYNKSEGQLILNPENPAYAPLVYSGEKLNEIKILGKAIAFQSDVK